VSASLDAARKQAPSLTLLAPLTRRLAGDERPAFMARLERLAGQRYQAWAKQAAQHASALLACAQDEEEIARRAEALFPLGAAPRAKLDALQDEALRIYDAVFVGLTLREQLALQASAERQGADVWRALAAALALAKPAADALAELARMEEDNARRLEQLLASWND
jgi:hypothetical protein